MEYEKLATAPEVASAIEVNQAQGEAQSNDGVYTFDEPQPKFGLIHAPAGAGAFEQQLGHRAVYAGTKCAQFGSPTAQPLRLIRHAGHGSWNDTAQAVLGLSKMIFERSRARAESQKSILLFHHLYCVKRKCKICRRRQIGIES